jgi:hypothetical protein
MRIASVSLAARVSAAVPVVVALFVFALASRQRQALSVARWDASENFA